MLNKKKVLFVAYGGGHVNMLAPVYDRMKCDLSDQFEVSFMALTAAQKILTNFALEFFTLNQYVNYFENALELGKYLVEKYNIPDHLAMNETNAYLGISFWDLIQQFGNVKAEELFSKHGRAAFFPVVAAKRILKLIKPDIVVVTNSPRWEKAMVFAANELSIPAIVLVDLFSDLEIEDRLKYNFYGSKICVGFEFARAKLLRSGRNSQDILLTGNPYYDKLNQLTESNETALKYRNLINGRISILWLKQGWLDNIVVELEVEKELYDFVAKNSNYLLIVRPHPNDHANYEKYESDSIVISKEPPNELSQIISECDAAITTQSTSILEAVLLNTPAYTIEYGPYQADCSFAEAKLTQGVYSLTELRALLPKLDKKLNQICNMQSTLEVGNSTNNIIEVIKEVINAKNIRQK